MKLKLSRGERYLQRFHYENPIKIVPYFLSGAFPHRKQRIRNSTLRSLQHGETPALGHHISAIHSVWSRKFSAHFNYIFTQSWQHITPRGRERRESSLLHVQECIIGGKHEDCCYRAFHKLVRHG